MSLELKKVNKSYGNQTILDNISFEVAKKNILMLLGSSGTGKTTLLKIISGVEEADSGKIILNGQDLQKIPIHKRQIGMLFQQNSLFPHLNIKNNLAFSLKRKKLRKKQIEEQIAQISKLFHLDEILHRFPYNLSGGETQRVAIARVFLRKPQLLLLDEPFAHLDTPIQYELRKEIKKICIDLNIPIIYVTHDQKEALATGNQLAILSRTQISQYGEPENIYNQPATMDIATFLGDPPINLLRGKIESGFFITKNLKIFIGQKKNFKNATIAIRPQHIYPDQNGVEVNIAEVSFHGVGYFIQLSIHNTFFNMLSIQFDIPKNKKIKVSFDTDKIIVFG